MSGADRHKDDAYRVQRARHGRDAHYQPEEALKSWVMSCDTLAQVTKPGDLPFPFPWVHRAFMSAYSGDPDSAVELLAPVLREREGNLGVDDTSTIK